MSPDALVLPPVCIEPDDSPPPVARQQSSYDEVLPEARALPEDKLLEFRGDDDLVYGNVMIGRRAVEPLRSMLGQVPGLPTNLLERLHTLALALLFAGRRIALATGKAQPAPVDMLRLRQLRMLFLHSLQAAATIELVPTAPLEAILAGRGNLDAAQDGIDLVAFYREHEKALVGKTPMTPALVEELETLSHEVRELLAVDGNLKATRPEDVAVARDDRRRIWTLLVEAHAQMMILATVGHGPLKAQEVVPSLQSRQALSRGKAAAAKKEPGA